MNRSSHLMVSARVTGSENPSALPHRLRQPFTRAICTRVMSSGGTDHGVATSRPLGHRFRFAVSKFHAPPLGVPSASMSTPCVRRISR